MSDTPDASEIIDSLKDYVERQKDLLKEDRDRLLKEGKERFVKVLEEKQDLFAKSLEQIAAGKSRLGGQSRTMRFRSFLRPMQTLFKRLRSRKQSAQLSLFTKGDTEYTGDDPASPDK